MKPFLKWAGNKYQIIARIQELLPQGKRLIEPFVGSGAVFLNTNYPEYLLADDNRDLIQLYRILQQDKQTFIEYCRSFFQLQFNQAAAYYELRTLFNTTQDQVLKAAAFIYLNKHCFNGLCRYNAKGEFNTPFGRYKQPYFPEREMQFFIARAQATVFEHADFVATMLLAKPGDVVYCDPPYVPLSKTASFTSYAAGGFGAKQQLQLAAMAEQLAEQGITVVISNHATEFTRQLYHHAQIMEFPVRRFISSKGAMRGKVTELLAVFGNAGDLKNTTISVDSTPIRP